MHPDDFEHIILCSSSYALTPTPFPSRLGIYIDSDGTVRPPLDEREFLNPLFASALFSLVDGGVRTICFFARG